MRALVAKYNLPPYQNPDGTYPIPSANNPLAYPLFPFANPPYAARAYAYVSAAQYDALVAAYFYKQQYNRAAPKEWPGFTAEIARGLARWPRGKSLKFYPSIKALTLDLVGITVRARNEAESTPAMVAAAGRLGLAQEGHQISAAVDDRDIDPPTFRRRKGNRRRTGCGGKRNGRRV